MTRSSFEAGDVQRHYAHLAEDYMRKANVPAMRAYQKLLQEYAAPDDADLFDGIPIPAPENQLAEITLEAGDEQVCDFELAGVNCI